MQPGVKKKSSVDEIPTKERCYITEVANDSGDEFVSISLARVRPNVTTAWHKLKGVTERYIVVGGQGCMEMGGLDPVDVSEGDIVRIPADIPQRIRNTGEIDLIFYTVCAPPFQKSCYVNLE